MRKMADRRLRLVLALSLAAFTLVVFRAAQIQVVDAAALSRKAVSQQRAVVPSVEERCENPRSASAKLRAAERTQTA